MAQGNYKQAIRTLRKAKWRSLLTMFGVIVGVVSVITTVSLGEGVKQQVLGQITKLGSDLITVRPGTIVERDKSGTIIDVDIPASYGFGSGSLSESDLDVVSKLPHVKTVSPISYMNTSVQNNGTVYKDGLVLGTAPTIPELLGQKVEFGAYFSEGEQNRQVAVIGKRVAEQVFKENVPIGLTLSIRGQDFIVRGVFEEFEGSALGTGIDLNKSVFIPYPATKALAKGSPQIVQILMRPDKPENLSGLITDVNLALRRAHDGENDITVLKQDENLAVTNSLLNLLTTLVATIAGISLVVGGIGIMNIMLVSVSERTREIGIRKAVGATNRQIRSQFLVEASILSFVGGLVGVILSFLVNFLLRVGTNLKPVITWEVVVIAVGVSACVGIVFGLAPAMKAARKDPIEALRYE